MNAAPLQARAEGPFFRAIVLATGVPVSRLIGPHKGNGRAIRRMMTGQVVSVRTADRRRPRLPVQPCQIEWRNSEGSRCPGSEAQRQHFSPRRLLA